MKRHTEDRDRERYIYIERGIWRERERERETFRGNRTISQCLNELLFIDSPGWGERETLLTCPVLNGRHLLLALRLSPRP